MKILDISLQLLGLKNPQQN